MYYEDLFFEKEDYKGKNFTEDEFYMCTFKNINFSEAILQEVEFSKCKFHNCNFTMTNILNLKLDDVYFEECTLRGWNFEELSPLVQDFNIENSSLEFVVFSNMKFNWLFVNWCW